MFKLFTWSDAFATAVPLVDEQHKVLVDLINRLGESFISSSDTQGEAYRTAHRALVQYTRDHFGDEETYMERFGLDPSFVRMHRHSHRAFVERLEITGSPDATTLAQDLPSLLDYLVCWLTDHILIVDQSMVRQGQHIQQGWSATAALEAEMQRSRTHAEPATEALRVLLWKLAESNTSLRTLNRELEQRIEQRTADLALANQQLRILSNQDDLTGLPNHRFAVASLHEQWTKARDTATPLAILLLDADRFKPVNDTHGHAVGDLLLRDLAHRLRNAVRSTDVVCRFGGDEFLIICPHTDGEGATRIARSVLDAQAPFFTPDAQPCWDGAVSIGVAQMLPAMGSIEALLESADQALYRAKQHAGGSFVNATAA